MLNNNNPEAKHPPKTLRDLDWETLTKLISERCKTERGAKRALKWSMCDTDEEARKSIDELSEANLLHEQNVSLAISVHPEIYDNIERLSRRGILDGEELIRAADLMVSASDLRRLLDSMKHAAPSLAGKGAKIKRLEDISGPIQDCFLPNGLLRDEASAELGSLRRRAKSLREEIVDRLKTMMEEPRIEKLLQDKYYTLREGRYVLPVKIECGHMLPGIVHARSGTEATVFLEPAEITELGNKLKMAFSEVELEERRILSELSSLLREEIPALEANLEILTQLDLISAAAGFCREIHGKPIDINKGEGLNITAAKHPLMAARNEPVVPNDFALEGSRSLVITGPNAGGKTVALKTVGMVCLMAQAGLHPPCGEGSSVPFYRKIYTSIGDDQDMAAGLSTFSAHMNNLNRILNETRDRDMVLLDEIAVGTEPTQGAALARAVLEALADSGAQILVTTHYTGLKALASEDKRFTNAAMEFDPKNRKPTYSLVRGMLGRSSALSVARSLGLPDKILNRAEELMGGQQSRLEGLMEDVEQKHELLKAELEKAETAAAEAQVREKRAAKLENSLREELKDLKKKTHDQAVLELRSLRDELERVRKVLAGEPKSKRSLKKGEETAAAAAERLIDLAPQHENLSGSEPKKGDLKIGDEVVIKSTGTKGKVVDLDGKGRPTVQAGTVKLRMKITDVLITRRAQPAGSEKPPAALSKADKVSKHTKQKKPQSIASRESEDPFILINDSSNTLDLRGMRVHEGLAELDMFIDSMLKQNREGFFVIHGYGTGAMQKAVREQLSISPFVQTFRPGRKGEGGEGVTVVFMEQ